MGQLMTEDGYGCTEATGDAVGKCRSNSQTITEVVDAIPCTEKIGESHYN